MTEPVLSAVLLNDAEELKKWSRKNLGDDFLLLFRICKLCGRPYGFHRKSSNECPTAIYEFKPRGGSKTEEFETEKFFVLDKETTLIYMAYLALLGVNFR